METLKKIGSVLVYTAIILSIVAFTLSTVDSINSTHGLLLDTIEFICMLIFIIEYVLNVWFKKIKFVLSFQGIIDLLVIVPFFFNTNSVFIRIFRLLRLAKLLRTIRYVADTERITNALLDIKKELVLFFILTLLTIFFAGAGIYVFEHEAQPEKFSSIVDGLWWAIVTLTTVGYGDVYPITIMGRLFTALIVICGLGIVAIPAGLIASSFSKMK